ncbi:hypothetical protein EZV62_017755 [Acer yangbiense]|uniref:Uncharacterized protein n=1 Tax=Acer yangbiense TaxID=1000413 RepID=A0A5C7HJ95_9ROSI|nr:hypothetical protein EZV62_017755 [Acer yangbiense]
MVTLTAMPTAVVESDPAAFPSRSINSIQPPIKERKTSTASSTGTTPPLRSVVSSIAQVLVAAYKKRRLQLPSADGVADTVFYDPPLEEKIAIVSKLALSSQFRPLNKAAIIEDANEISSADGCCKNPWRLCSIQQVEELKCLVNIVPIWPSAIISEHLLSSCNDFSRFNFVVLGFMEFYNKQFPEHMRSVGNSLIFLTVSVAIYVSSLVVTLVHCCTRKDDGHPDWLTDDINAGKLDYFYFLIAGMGSVNFIYFMFAASRYRYKTTRPMEKWKQN